MCGVLVGVPREGLNSARSPQNPRLAALHNPLTCGEHHRVPEGACSGSENRAPWGGGGGYSPRCEEGAPRSSPAVTWCLLCACVRCAVITSSSSPVRQQGGAWFWTQPRTVAVGRSALALASLSLPPADRSDR
jgi:hypothetical protein